MKKNLKKLFTKPALQNLNRDDILILAKELYIEEIHPFDFSKQENYKCKKLVEIGTKLIRKNGLDD